MPRTLEPLQSGKFYHIYNHANGNENLFRCDDNYLYFLSKYAKYIHPIADTFAYCLLPNHFHLFLRFKPLQEMQNFKTLDKLKEEIYFSKQFSNLFNGYSQAYNKMYKRMGSLFVPRFKRKLVTDTNYFVNLVHYIHLNPVNHGFVSNPTEWKYSSFNSFLATSPTKLNKEEVLDWFNDIENFKNTHAQKVTEKFRLEIETF